MPKKTIFAQAEQEYWVDVAAKLQDKYGWEISYIIGSKKYSKKVSKLFPHSVFHVKEESRKGLAPAVCDMVLSSPLDRTLLSAMSSYESIFMKMMDRYDFDGSLTYHKRISVYHSQVMYWKGVLEHFRPDVVVYRITPHTSYDYILYALCRIMNIPTIMFERTSLPGLVFPVKSFEEGSMILRRGYTEELAMFQKQDISLRPETTAHLENLSKSFTQAMPYHLKYKLKHYKKGGDVGGSLTILSRFAMDFIVAFLHKKGDYKYLHKRYYENMGLFKRKKLLTHYNLLAEKVDLKVPYIFVALQCEPERQTCPTGGVFGHQYVMIDLLSKLIPDGWMLYVKEHVSQFKEYQAAERSKTFDFYNIIASKANVELVPLSYTSFELIDHSKASATVSGTVGWESVVRGKPALLFGHSWYRDCRGVFVTHTVEECKEAIRKIQNGFQVDRNELICFAKAVENCSVRGYIDKFYEKMNIVSHEENVENLAQAIYEFTS
jgi:hypothetical protein